MLWFDLPIGSIKRISTKSFVDDLILGQRDVSFRAVSYCELLNLISNLTWRFECYVIHSSHMVRQNWNNVIDYCSRDWYLPYDRIVKTSGLQVLICEV